MLYRLHKTQYKLPLYCINVTCIRFTLVDILNLQIGNITFLSIKKYLNKEIESVAPKPNDFKVRQTYASDREVAI